MIYETDGDVSRTGESNCLYCGFTMNALGALEPGGCRPKPGDVTLCIRCGAVMRLDKKLLVRPMTPAEVKEIEEDQEYMEFLRKMVGVIRFIQASKG